jgi:hypothetical protein
MASIALKNSNFSPLLGSQNLQRLEVQLYLLLTIFV